LAGSAPASAACEPAPNSKSSMTNVGVSVGLDRLPQARQWRAMWFAISLQQ